MGRTARLGIIAALAIAAGLIGAGVFSASDGGTPAPVVWRDHVVESTPTTAAP
jgi:hypothetical protein